jgi:replicative DNA helicase
LDIHEYEKLILGIILRYPSGNNRIPQRVVAELSNDKFDPTQPNGKIYEAIQGLVQKGIVPNVPNVVLALNSASDSVGGEPYLQSLLGYPALCGVSGYDGFEQYVKVIDSAGRLRHLAQVVGKYNTTLKDFEAAVEKIGDVDNYLSSFVAEINQGAGRVKSSYCHVSVAVEEEKRRLALERQGVVTDLVPTGWPNLEKYFIPRPATFGVIAGITSMGKTQFALQIMLGVAIWLKETNTPGCVAINELESAGWRLNRRLACCLASVDSNALALGKVSDSALKKYYEKLEYISELPIYLDDNSNMNSMEMTWQALALHIEKGPRVLGIADYVELFTDAGDSEELRVSNIVRNHRRIVGQTGGCEISISQFNNSVLHTASKMGGAGRTRYSGAIEHAADWFIEIYNPITLRRRNIEYTLPDNMSDDMAYALITKNKDHSLGQEPFSWVPEFTQFRDASLGMNEGLYRKPKVEEDF